MNQILDDPFMPNRTLLAVAESRRRSSSRAAGTYGTMPIDAILGPGRWNVDIGLSRSFRIGGSQTMQFRWEIFNVFNTMTPNNPVSALNSSGLREGDLAGAGTAPRIMQLAVKYGF